MPADRLLLTHRTGLRMQIPQSEATLAHIPPLNLMFQFLFLHPFQEKEKIVKAVVKQENAVTAMQAIARAPVLQSSHQCCLFGPLCWARSSQVDNE